MPEINDMLNEKGWVWTLLHFTLFVENVEKRFFLECERTQKGIFYIWVYVIGTSKEEEKFTYNFTLYNTNKVILIYVITE